ncbi:MAG: DinB family protein [bacterium]
MMLSIAREIRGLVDEITALLEGLTTEDISAKESPESWSKKEILGHLIDSACNNHQRFVRAACHAANAFPAYNQRDWIRVQRYQESDWGNLIILWSAYNRHLSDLIERIPDDALSSPCNIGKDDPVTLEFLAQDYLRHMRHHLNQILGR